MDDWEEFMSLLNELKNGKSNIPAFAPFDKTSQPKTWEEVIKRVKELPGDDPITWLPLNDKSVTVNANLKKSNK